MKQRAAIARALAMEPRVLLMDEPFAALDALTRLKMQEELLRLWEEAKFTVLFVTHSIAEAIRVGNRILMLSPHPGRVKGEIASSGKDDLDATGRRCLLGRQLGIHHVRSQPIQHGLAVFFHDGRKVRGKSDVRERAIEARRGLPSSARTSAPHPSNSRRAGARSRSYRRLPRNRAPASTPTTSPSIGAAAPRSSIVPV